MPLLSDLKSKFSNLSVNTSSTHPTPKDSAHIETTLFGEDTTPSPSKQNAEVPLISNIIVKHSSAFNSERNAGMNKLQQLQFVQGLKGAIIDEAPVIYMVFVKFKVVTTRGIKACPASPEGFCNAAVHTASLIAGGVLTDWTVLERSEECEYLADAVENLWGRVLMKAGEVTGKLKVGQKLPVRDEQFERVESGETLVAPVEGR